MTPRVYWSDRLEVLAEGLFTCWEACAAGDPFARFCVVVGDLATRNWLQHAFLFHRLGTPQRRILANIDFVPLAEFVNDWLSAQVHGLAHGRKASEHPYARGVMAWRLDRLLRTQAERPIFAPLHRYLQGQDADDCARRRHALAAQLAACFDGYLASRYPMLVQWARGDEVPRAQQWQAELYRLLVQEEPGTYARDYERALAPEADLTQAFEAGFPRYAGVAVFDVAVAPWPYLQMLRRVGEVLPMTWWNFNPSRQYWLEDLSSKRAARLFAAELRQALARGGELPAFEAFFPAPGSKLLGALASGARGVLAAEFEMEENGCQWLSDLPATTPDFAALRAAHPELHSCTGARRELEVAKDAIHRFLCEHPAARACDVVLLCADWEGYAPLVEAVFMGGQSGHLPVALYQGAQRETPLMQAWGDLLAFRENRFEASALFALLGVPEIRARFALSADEVHILREMVRSGNIHWGADAADVARVMALPGEAAPTEAQTPYTWRRGLDRMIADALLGPGEQADEGVELPHLGALLPMGEVEGERAIAVGKLCALVSALKQWRAFLQSDHPAEAWQAGLLEAIEGFFQAESELALQELAAFRRAIVAVCNEALIARQYAHAPREMLPGAALCAAVLQAIKPLRRAGASAGDAVRVAPLTLGAAVPAQMVWICGLNDGLFPRSDIHPSFDLAWREPTLFDVSTREMDGLALLKAALGARSKLGLSYVGQDAQSLERLPAAVPLQELLEWFERERVAVARYTHPLQGYSPRYFASGASAKETLPPSFNAESRAIAEVLAGGEQVAPVDCRVVPFAPEGAADWEVDAEALAAFYARPNAFLARERLRVYVEKPQFDRLEDEENLAVQLPSALMRALFLEPERVECSAALAAQLREGGYLPAQCDLAAELSRVRDEAESCRARPIAFRSKAENQGLACPTATLLEAYAQWLAQGREVRADETLAVADRTVHVRAQVRLLSLPVVPAGRLDYTFCLCRGKQVYDSALREAWVRHVAVQAAGHPCATVLFVLADKAAKCLLPMPQEAARAALTALLEGATQPHPFALRRAVFPAEDVPEEAAASALEGMAPWLKSTYGKRMPKV